MQKSAHVAVAPVLYRPIGMCPIYVCPGRGTFFLACIVIRRFASVSLLVCPPHCVQFDIVSPALSEQPGALGLQKVLINLLVDFGVMAAAALCYNFET